MPADINEAAAKAAADEITADGQEALSFGRM